jgi:hypothetical protein
MLQKVYGGTDFEEVIEVVQMDTAGSLSSQSTTAGSGVWRISAESTLVSSKIMSRTAQGAQSSHATQGYRRLTRPAKARSDPGPEAAWRFVDVTNSVT